MKKQTSQEMFKKILREPLPRSRRFEPRGVMDALPRPLKPRPPNPFKDPFRPGQQRPTPPGAKAKLVQPDRYPMEFAPVDVLDVRARFHATQAEFARMIGISVETLRNWEQGKRRPQGPARALLRVAAANPNVVAAALLRFKRGWWMSW
jgi:putative transcriptional regulator